jgi:hypothetical protein
MSRSSVVPDEPTALALVVQDDKQTEAHRHAALESLDRLVIQRISSNLAPESDEFHQEALAFIWNRLAINRKFDPDRGRFEAWCTTILHRFHIDLERRRIRSRRRQVNDFDVEDLPDPCEGSADHVEDLLDRMNRLLDSLDCISAGFDATCREVDYFAVLLLQLRLAMARRIRLEPDDADLLPEKVSELITWAMPWRLGEGDRSFKPGWPVLQAVWEVVGEALNQPPFSLGAPELCDLLTQLIGRTSVVTADLWNHWVKRAKEQTRVRVDQRTWEDCFADFLPDHDPPVLPDSEGETP